MLSKFTLKDVNKKGCLLLYKVISHNDFLLLSYIKIVSGEIMENKLSVKNIKKTFMTGKEIVNAIDDISFDVKDGEIVGIVGTSGCGKSTLLNIIAGLENPTSGCFKFNSENPKISYMLQSDALLPWKSVKENACLGLELLKIKNNETKNYTKTLLEKYGLKEFIDKKSNSLSGGMKQRVALIRSLAIKPDILLLDEPFSALDYYTRITIAEDVYKIIKEMKITTIIITHDIAEALSISDKIIVLSSRPSKVKSIYDLDLPKSVSLIEKRALPKFNEMYEKIWRDLDVKI